MQVPHGADAFEQRSQVQDRGLRLPLADDLHVDRQPFLARTEPHRQAGQAGDVERHGRALEVGGIHGLAVDGELLDAMLVGRDRQHVGNQRVVAREVVGIAVAQPLDRLLGVDIVLHAAGEYEQAGGLPKASKPSSRRRARPLVIRNARGAAEMDI
jgi:hypothetical protein